ncbi:rhodanese-like domain-containing protein [Achromobacter piechaudii]|uniref:Thiosulfate sulfurtransferase GlpE n=2 Tax=Achromobacter piechaudii TaxID=72556 RepID=A0A6S7CAZ4_9BURK|nr:rhodanese-like domain-containing protein [Achromobacter piechaudii]EFF78127.1 rhodanese-like protein [Achromobacter piechaudii ATCC 43553]CAB3669710.1 Thiosulfate sulfurtransferase GlpE [Achromobacter piechaudii]CAB3834089.1 Thiosulfate sulfurtransferase GlpE [Achromobacter piechaudii]CAB3837763.1 Thiosulfate sulfurtransferase GlpE [Achromobacter piechaudii]CAB3943518.1 Thiosulfate sulfurtransferase GlpE [Achromobacter piechaudii]
MDLLQFLLDKNNVFIVGVAVVSGVMLAIPALRRGRSGSAVSTGEAIQMVNQRNAVWVDVRPVEQFQAGHIAQARNVPVADLEQKAASLPKNKPLILVCDNGRDSARAAAKLRAQGLADVVPLEGGMRAWSAASLPVTQKG